MTGRGLGVKPDLWIVGPPHSGTTLLVKILEEAGQATREVSSEPTELGTLNVKIIRNTFGKVDWIRDPVPVEPEGVFAGLPDALVESMATYPFPLVVKDPRWSLSLPSWLLLAPRYQLPHSILFTRRLDAMAHSLAIHKGDQTRSRVEDTRKAMIDRAEHQSIQRGMSIIMGIRVFSTTFPEFGEKAVARRQLALWLGETFCEPDEKFYEAIQKVFDPQEVHYR